MDGNMTKSEHSVLGVLLDFDGVVVDSTGIHLKAWQNAYRQMFEETLSKQELQELVGRSSAFISQHLCRKQSCAWRADDLFQKKASCLNDSLDELELMPGSRRLCEALKSRSIPFGIVSNAPRNFIAASLKQSQLSVPFFFGYEDYSRAKPHPDPYLLGARTLQLPFPQYYRILSFEDSAHGIRAACQAYTTVIGITSHHPEARLSEAGAVRCFANLGEALDAGILDWQLSPHQNRTR